MATLSNPLRCSSLALDVDQVLVGPASAPRLFVGHSPGGQRWLAALIFEHPAGQCWLCAAHSELAITALRSGRAGPADLFRHSGDGTVEMIAVNDDGVISEVFRLCRELTDDELACISSFALAPSSRASRRGPTRAGGAVASSSSVSLPA